MKTVLDAPTPRIGSCAVWGARATATNSWMTITHYNGLEYVAPGSLLLCFVNTLLLIRLSCESYTVVEIFTPLSMNIGTSSSSNRKRCSL